MFHYLLPIAQAGSPAPGDSTESSSDVNGVVDTNTENVWQTLNGMWDGFVSHIPQFLIGVIVFIVFCFAANLTRGLIRRATDKRANANLGRVLGRLAQWGVIFAGLLIAAAIIAPSVKPVDLLAGLGIGGVAIGFAFKDILQNFLAGILILIREPFKIGDEIKSGSHEGTVEEIETRATTIQTFDGKRVVIPNSQIYTNPVVVNTAHRQRRSEYEIRIDSTADLGQTVKTLHQRIRLTDGVSDDPSPDVLVEDLSDGKVHLRCRWWTSSDEKTVTGVRNEVIRRVKKMLDTNNAEHATRNRVA